MIVLRKIYLFFIIFLITPNHYSQAFSIARIHYNGGGDWYGAPSSLPNLLEYVEKNTSIIVETDENVQGLGLTTDMVSANIISAIVEGLKPALIGKDPFDNERHWHEMWRPKLVGRRGITTRAIGGIDIALWDIKGKALGIPLYKLLGGFTNKVEAYVAGGYYEKGKGLKELADEMKSHLDIGARAVKMKIGGVPINEDVERVKVVREAIGKDIKLMVDANNAYRHYQAMEVARKIEETLKKAKMLEKIVYSTLITLIIFIIMYLLVKYEYLK